jgi:WD40 repeat protein
LKSATQCTAPKSGSPQLGEISDFFCLQMTPRAKWPGEIESKLWDAATGKAAEKLEGHTGQVADLALSKDGTVLASAGQDKRVLIWHLDANTC